MPTNTSEKGLETRICNLLQEAGWLPGDSQDYNAASCVDLAHLAAFLNDTQPETAQALHLDQDDNTRRQFLQRLHRQIDSRGIIDVLRNGIEHGAHSIRLFYGTPSLGNEQAAALNAKNRFSVTRQVHYSPKNTGLSLDLVLFINGLPILTFELKNNLTRQTAEDAVEQYRTSRDPREDLFRPGRCAAHMAVDENKVRFCAELAGPKSVLSEETDPDKLHDLKGTLDQYQVYSWEQIKEFVEAFLNGINRGELDSRLDTCVEEYRKLDEDGQVEFKSSAKAFTRLYAFLSQVLPYGNANWEKLSIFLSFLVNKLPAPVEEDLSRGVLDAVDMESYRMERKAAQSISLAAEDAEIDPPLPGAGGGAHEPEMDRLSNIINKFNKTWGGKFSDPGRVSEVLNRMPEQVLEDQQYQNARKNSGRQNAQVELDSALRRLVTSMVRCQTELYKAYAEDREFREWLNGEMFRATY